MDREPTAEDLRAAGEDHAAYGRVYRAYVMPILAFTTSRVYDVDTAWDLTAETFARGYLKHRSFRGRTDVEARAWIFAIARREILQFQRRRRIERKAMKRLGVEPAPLADDDHERILELAGVAELRTTVRKELGRLGEGQRAALTLRIVEDLPYEQVADRLGVSEPTARVRVSRALSALADAVELRSPTLEEGTP